MLNNTIIRILTGLGIIYGSVQWLIRLVLLFLSSKDVSWSITDLLRGFGLGLAYDFVVCLCLLAPLALFLFFVEPKLRANKWCAKLTKAGIVIFCISTVYTAVSEIFFWEEFHTRFNFIAVDYLVYSQELFKNIWEAYPVIPLVIGIIIVSLFIASVFMKWAKISENNSSGWATRGKILGVYIIAMVLGLMGLNSEHISLTSKNRFNQEVSGNGVFQLFHAFFHNELDYNSFYISYDDQEIMKVLRGKLSQDGSLLNNDKGVARQTAGTGIKNKKPNIVVITVESLSAKFTGFVDKKESLTPYLDELADEAYTFDRVYATGTRTVRGLEAISLSLPPTPGQSILRRPDCKELFTIGTPLQKQGYKTQFVYGGYGYFDNMNGFFEDNGFAIYDRTDIPKEDIYFETVWGVADEIIFDKALEQMDKETAKQPTMQLILTTTNHSPYTFPEGSIKEPQGKRESVVKYTDYAIKKYLQKAKTKKWFDNTVFIILADHNASVAGRAGLPVSKYHIPCIVYAPKLIKPGHNKRLMSQIDIFPTVLGTLGISYETKNMGYDYNKLPEGQERAFISTYQELGYIAEDKLIVLTPGSKVKAYKINDFDTSDYTEITPSEELIKEAVIWYQGASYLYKNKLLKAEFK